MSNLAFAPFSGEPSSYTRQQTYPIKDFGYASDKEKEQAARLNPNYLGYQYQPKTVEPFKNIYSQYPQFQPPQNYFRPQQPQYTPQYQSQGCNCQKNDNIILFLLLIIIGLLLRK